MFRNAAPHLLHLITQSTRSYMYLQFKYPLLFAFPAINPDTCVFMATRKGYKHTTTRTHTSTNEIYKDS